MAVSHRFLKKASTATLLMWMTVSILSPVVWAEDVTPTDTPTQTPSPDPTPPPADPTGEPETTVSETPSPSPTPETTNVIDSGDAAAAAETDTTVNINDNEIPGEITQEDSSCAPEGETPCDGDITIETDNAATASSELDATADSGENTITGATGSARISSGDAQALGEISTQANTNEVILQTPAPTQTLTPTPDPESTPDQTPIPETEVKKLTVENSNLADVADNADVTSITGENSAVNNSGDVVIDTGDAQSLVNVLNIINTNIVGSNVQVLTLDLTCHENSDIDLNAIWQQLLVVDENGNVSVNPDIASTPNLKITVTNQNQANVSNDVTATADSGNNSISESGSATITTGDAAAAANVTNLVNTNLFGSKFFIGIINILTAQNINLILPRPEFFDPASSALIFQIPVSVNNQNQAAVTNNVSSTANSGENSSINSSQSIIDTGDAVATANSTTLANLNIIGNNWFFLILNNAGGWTGNIVNWMTAGSVQKPDLGVNILETGFDPSAVNSTGENDPDGPPVAFNNSNQVQVTNNINVNANTGRNVTINNAGGSGISTGNAWAFANLFNLINTNIMGSRWFMSAINILGDWSGDAIFAYPDVGITVASDRQNVEPGDIISLNLHYQNSGYDTARGVRLNLDLPAGMNFVSDDGRLTGGCQQTFCSWEVGNLNARQAGDFGVNVRISDDFSFDNSQAFWSRLIPSVKAQDERKSREIPVKATVAMTDPDPDTQNNSYLIREVVYEKGPANADNRQPQITVSAVNNVNGFVYPGDTITFEIKINNNSDTPLYKAQLVHKLYGQSGAYLGSMLFELNSVEAYKSGRLTFGLTVPPGAPAGTYTTEAYVTGEAPNGNQVTSSSADTRFAVKSREVFLPGSEQTAEVAPEQVLGDSSQNQTPPKKENTWNFVMLIAMSTVLSANQLERRRNWRETVKRLLKIRA
jgi:uncharacterized repeat protein (TIGR01451 family)